MDLVANNPWLTGPKKIRLSVISVMASRFFDSAISPKKLHFGFPPPTQDLVV